MGGSRRDVGASYDSLDWVALRELGEHVAAGHLEETVAGEIAECFAMFDRDRDGLLTPVELACASVALLGCTPAMPEARTLLDIGRKRKARAAAGSSATTAEAEEGEEVDPDTVGCVDLGTFGAFAVSKLARRGASDDARQVFNAMDTDGKGYLTRDDLARAHLACGGLPKALAGASAVVQAEAGVLDDAFRAIDRDRDGRVGFSEFDHMMRSAQGAGRLLLYGEGDKSALLQHRDGGGAMSDRRTRPRMALDTNLAPPGSSAYARTRPLPRIDDERAAGSLPPREHG